MWKMLKMLKNFQLTSCTQNTVLPIEMKGIVCDQVNIVGMQVPAPVLPQSPYVLKNSDNKTTESEESRNKNTLKRRNHARMVKQNETAEKLLVR